LDAGNKLTATIIAPDRGSYVTAAQEVAAPLLGSAIGNTVTAKRTKAAIAERQKFSALLKMLRAGLT
jgi:hypothetical protein